MPRKAPAKRKKSKLQPGFAAPNVLRCVCDPRGTLRRIKLEEAQRFQRDLKVLPEQAAEKLDAAMETKGFLAPLFLWYEHDAILDGTQRRDRLAERGWTVDGGIPVVEIEAADEKDAAEKLLLIASQYGQVQAAGVADFAGAFEIDLQAFTLPEFAEIDWGRLEDGFGGVGDQAQQVYTDNEVVDSAFDYFRREGFPYHTLPIHVCMQRINKLAAIQDNSALRSSRLGLHVADTYHSHRFHVSAEGMKSPLQAFGSDKDLRKALRLRLEEQGSIGAGWIKTLALVNGTQACANFRPGFALSLYREFCPDNAVVLDTSTGYGGRLVGFIAAGQKQYIGVDPNTETHEANNRMAADMGAAARVELHCSPIEDLAPKDFTDRADFAFTSPPYFAKEHYSEDDTQSWVRYQTAEEWRDSFLLPMLQFQFIALKAGSTSVVNIADVQLRKATHPLVRWATECAADVGFEFIDRREFRMSHRFGSGNDEVAVEPVLVFRKPRRLGKGRKAARR